MAFTDVHASRFEMVLIFSSGPRRLDKPQAGRPPWRPRPYSADHPENSAVSPEHGGTSPVFTLTWSHSCLLKVDAIAFPAGRRSRQWASASRSRPAHW